jgi:hypothetical protein
MAFSGNVGAIAEGKKVFVFPNETNLVSNIPMWMKFFCYEYNASAAGRASSYNRSQNSLNVPGMTNLKALICVPAPANFVSTTQHTYKPEEKIYEEDIVSAGVSKGKGYLGAIDTYLSTSLIYNALKTAAEWVAGTADEGLKLAGYKQLIESDFTDQVYKPGGQVRSYEISIYMPCLSIEDSRKAGEIIRAFEALSLPTALSLLDAKSTFFYHPPLWVFGVGPIDAYKFDPDWSGYPQISVLKTVKSKKIALDVNSLSALGDGNGIFKPIAYTLSLIFQELEPAVRVTGAGTELSTLITNRSGVITSGGIRNPFASSGT